MERRGDSLMGVYLFAFLFFFMALGVPIAFAMAMGHVILNEYYWGEPSEFFTNYTRHYTDFPDF